MRRNWRVLVGLAIVTGVVIVSFAPGSLPEVDKQARIGEVYRGDMTVQVYGYGRLHSKHQRLLTSEVQGVVEQITLKPGAQVQPDSVIMILSAPELQEQVAAAELEYARFKAEFESRQLDQKDELLSQHARIAQLTSDLELAELRVKAESELIRDGIVSDLDFQRSKLSARQLRDRLEIADKRRETLKVKGDQQTRINQNLLAHYGARLNFLRDKVNRLEVRAGIAGVVQALAVELGQSVSLGADLATVGSTSELKAALKVPQNQVDRIAPGQRASIVTQGQSIAASVARIDPVVTEGSVVIELDISGALSPNARPDLTVEGRIDVAHLHDVLLLDVPVDIGAFATRRLFVIDEKNSTANAAYLEFGDVSGGRIQVLNGASEGQRIILSDTSQWHATDTLALTR